MHVSAFAATKHMAKKLLLNWGGGKEFSAQKCLKKLSGHGFRPYLNKKCQYLVKLMNIDIRYISISTVVSRRE